MNDSARQANAVIEREGITVIHFLVEIGEGRIVVSFWGVNLGYGRGKRSVTTDTALRLARVLGVSADVWLGLQQDRDLWHAMRSDRVREIDDLEPLCQVSPDRRKRD